MNMTASVLVIEDHRDLAETIYDALENAGYQVDYANDGVTGLALAVSHRFDAIVLDLMLPRMDGYEVCQALRSTHQLDTPVLMLTARDTLDEKLEGFDKGADDYLVKPFAMAELLARIGVLIKRKRGEMTNASLGVGDISIDPQTMTVLRQGKTITLSPTCFGILRILMRESPKVVSRVMLEQELWGDDLPDSDALRSHMYTLRKRVDKPFPSPLIHTIKGVGYKLDGES